MLSLFHEWTLPTAGGARKRDVFLRLLKLCSIFLVVSTLTIASEDEDRKKSLDPEVEILLGKILKSQEETHTLEGTFTQKKCLSLLREPETSSGTFRFQEPDRIRLDYAEPSPVVLLLNGETLVNYYPDLNEAEMFDVRKQKKRVFDHLLGEKGSQQLKKNFSIILVDETKTMESDLPQPFDDAYHLHLTPTRRQLKKRLKSIDLWVRISDFLPLQYLTMEQNGDSTLFHLDNLKLNQPIADEVFSLDFPEDVRITVRSGGKNRVDESKSTDLPPESAGGTR